jgi:hypothetical protein
MKLVSRERVGPKYRKRYDKAREPFQRLLEHDAVSEPCKKPPLPRQRCRPILLCTLKNRRNFLYNFSYNQISKQIAYYVPAV